jgi:hypothetical protein
MTSAEKIIFSMRHRVILPGASAEASAVSAAAGSASGSGAPGSGAPDNGAIVARQVDAVLMKAGFKCSGGLLGALGALTEGPAIDLGVEIIGWARELAGDHVQHNAYFIDFPANVPDTLDFWVECIRDALADPVTAAGAEAIPAPGGGFVVNLLSLPKYGNYQHTYAEMLARHEELVPALSDRITVLHLGRSLAEEAATLYGELAASTVPLNRQALAALRFLADFHGGATSTDIPVRENKAIINAARVRAGVLPKIDTPTDVLRIAAELSGGDVTLATVTRFRSLPRPQRRVLLAALDTVVGNAPGKLADVSRHAEQWKRLGERLHPHERAIGHAGHAKAGAADVFAVARGEKAAPSLAGLVEAAFGDDDVARAVKALAVAPGMLWRAADRVLRASAASAARDTAAGDTAAAGSGLEEVLESFAATAPQVSGRVLLSVREHLQNRIAVRPGAGRIFVNRAGRGYVTPDTRPALAAATVARMLALIDAEIERRLPVPGRLVVDPAIEPVALPLSGKAAPEGLRVFPRGSVTPVEGDVLRFFVYWRQRKERTDFDLSAIITGEQLDGEVWLSYTNLRTFAGEHSGDITEAASGASEFINLDLAKLGRRCVIPQVYVFSGEGFGEVAENIFGFMTMGAQQKGAPFEPRTVRARSALHGDGRVAMPLAFYRGEDGRWYAKWLHLYLRGTASRWGGTRVEENRVTSRLLTRSILDRDYLRVGYLAGLLRRKAATATATAATAAAAGAGGTAAGAGDDVPVTYIGVEQPEDLPPESTVYTLANLASLIPK